MTPSRLPLLLVLALMLNAALTMADEPADAVFAPGQSLDPLLAGERVAGLRFSLDGAPPGARDALPPAPNQPGLHWLIVHDEDGRPVHWRPFRVGEATADQEIALTLAIDAEGPRIALEFSGPQWRLADGTLALAEASRSEIRAEDAAGVEALELLVDGEPVASADGWQSNRSEGRYRLSARARDGLGNLAESEPVEVLLDRSPPQVSWTRADDGAELSAQTFDGRRLRLRVQASDAGSGVSHLEHAGQRHDGEALADGIVLTVNAETLDYAVEDRLGNRASGRIGLRVDRDGPRLVASQAGQALALNDAVLSRGKGVIVLEAQDEGAGVASACVETSIWYGQCRELPLRLEGIADGHYRLTFRAADRLGNRSFEHLRIEVRP